jgi:long-chain fatty acid transport protein
LDYVNWGWSSYDSLVIDFREEFETTLLQDSRSPRLYDDVYQIRFGAEYNVRAVKGLMVRAGLGFDKNPVPEETLDPTLPDTDRLLSSFGLSYQITSNIGVNMYYTFIRGAERLVDLPTNKHAGYYNTYANIAGFGVSMGF